jgi:high-affinity Fe2+/Pb2+ permease
VPKVDIYTEHRRTPFVMTVQVFAVPVFLVVFRESLETVIIVSVLLAFLKQTLDGPDADKAVYKKLIRQVCHVVLDQISPCPYR